MLSGIKLITAAFSVMQMVRYHDVGRVLVLSLSMPITIGNPLVKKTVASRTFCRLIYIKTFPDI
jgi:hypothetical protein